MTRTRRNCAFQYPVFGWFARKMPNWKSTSWDVGAKTFYQIFSLLVQAGIWHLCLQILWREIAEWSVVKPENTFHFWQTFLPRERIFPNLSTLAQNKLKVLIKSLPKLWKGYGKIHQTQLVVGELGWVGRCSQSALVDKGGEGPKARLRATSSPPQISGSLLILSSWRKGTFSRKTRSMELFYNIGR